MMTITSPISCGSGHQKMRQQPRRAGFLGHNRRFGNVAFDVIRKVGFMSACRQAVLVPIIAQHTGGFLRFDQVWHRCSVLRERRKFPGRLLPIVPSHPKLSIIAPVASIKSRNSTIAPIVNPDKLCAMSLCVWTCASGCSVALRRLAFHAVTLAQTKGEMLSTEKADVAKWQTHRT